MATYKIKRLLDLDFRKTVERIQFRLWAILLFSLVKSSDCGATCLIGVTISCVLGRLVQVRFSHRIFNHSKRH